MNLSVDPTKSWNHGRLALLIALVTIVVCQPGGTLSAQAPLRENDLILGLSRSNPTLTLEVVRGPAQELGGELEGGFWDVASIQAVEFDNLNGISHNPAGNLLGVSFGANATSGGLIYSLSTQDGPNPSRLIGDTTGLGGSGLAVTRLGGISVSPDNAKVAVTGYDTGRVLVFDYQAAIDSSSSASLSNARQTEAAVISSFNTQGTAWLDSQSLMAFATDGRIVQVDSTSMATTPLVQLPTEGGPDKNRSEYTDIEYNPLISPYIYASYGAFDRNLSVTINRLYVVDPNNQFSLVKTVDLVGTMESAREIALDSNGNLFLGQFGGRIDVLLNAKNPSELTDNSTIDWYIPTQSASFSGLDIAVNKRRELVGIAGDFNSDGLLTVLDIDSLTVAVRDASSDKQYDLTGDGLLNEEDRRLWVNGLRETYYGDADLDGSFGSGDLVAVFAAGKYENGQPAGWAEGDWDGNGIFDTGDLVVAFAEGGYEAGPRTAVSAVPEPIAPAALVLLACLAWRRRGQRHTLVSK